MLDKLLNRQAREERKENPINFALPAFFAIDFVRIANIVRLEKTITVMLSSFNRVEKML